jgi:hypothetical protein
MTAINATRGIVLLRIRSRNRDGVGAAHIAGKDTSILLLVSRLLRRSAPRPLGAGTVPVIPLLAPQFPWKPFNNVTAMSEVEGGECGGVVAISETAMPCQAGS